MFYTNKVLNNIQPQLTTHRTSLLYLSLDLLDMALNEHYGAE